MTELFLIVGLAFGPLAGLIAFLITFNEWKKHKFEGWQLWGEPIKRGVLTFIFFLALALVLSYVLPLVI